MIWTTNYYWFASISWWWIAFYTANGKLTDVNLTVTILLFLFPKQILLKADRSCILQGHFTGTNFFISTLKNLRLFESFISLRKIFHKQYVLGLPSTPIHLYLFSHQNVHFSQVIMWFLTPTHIQIFLHFLIKNHVKTGIQGNNLHIFLWHFKI